MKPIVTTATAVVLALSLAIGAAPANAATLYFGFGTQGNTRMQRGDFERHGDYAYYNNHRGSRHQVQGYRYYQGYWFPPAAFLGLFLAPLLNSGVHRSAHVQWCFDHYRSYRASDNTFQPNHGPRQQCVSPYR